MAKYDNLITEDAWAPGGVERTYYVNEIWGLRRAVIYRHRNGAHVTLYADWRMVGYIDQKNFNRAKACAKYWVAYGNYPEQWKGGVNSISTLARSN